MLLTVLLAFVLAAPADPPEAASVQVRDAMLAWLDARYPALRPRLDVRVLRMDPEAEAVLTSAPEPLRLDVPHPTAVPHARTQVTLLAGSEAAGYEKIGWAMLYVAHFDSLVVPTRTVRPDDPLAPEAVQMAWTETTTFRGEPLTPAAYRELLAQGDVFAVRTLREGRPLRSTDVRPPYLVDTGSSVRMHYARGRLAMTLTCKAREAGALGDEVRLYAPDTKTTYRARITGPGTAIWIETL